MCADGGRAARSLGMEAVGLEVGQARTAAPLASTPSKPPYDMSKLMWNERRTRNNKRQYSYSGRTKEKVSALCCTHCRQWFYLDEINHARLLPPGFLEHQRNYRFSCAWCCSRLKLGRSSRTGSSGDTVASAARADSSATETTDSSWVEQFELTKPKKYEAIVDAFLNLMATAEPR